MQETGRGDGAATVTATIGVPHQVQGPWGHHSIARERLPSQDALVTLPKDHELEL